MHVFLIGFMGCGKSTTGKKLAPRLNYKFIDLDRRIEEQQLLTVPQLFKQYGEEIFRLKERDALLSLRNEKKDCVIAAGGGTPCYFNNIQQMKGMGLVIYLKMNAEMIVSRLKQSIQERPLIEGKTPEELLKYAKDKLKEREVFYNQAQMVFDARNFDIDMMKHAIEEYIRYTRNQ